MPLLETIQEEVLQKLGRVGVAARQAVESVLQGQHRSIRHGLSVEFAGHRPYQPGDDLRHLDWLVYARTDRFNVRVYEEETHMRATLVVDCSGSMDYGSGGLTKLDYTRMLAGALGFLMVRQTDAIGLALVDHRVREFLPPKATMGHFLRVLDRLETVPPGGETSLATVLNDLADRVTRRGLLILVTDTFDDPEKLVLALQHLRHRRQDVRLFQVLDPEEETFPFQGTHEFVGLEREVPVRLDGDRVRRRYREALEAHMHILATGCHANQIPLVRCRTDEDLAMALIRTLAGPWVRGGSHA